MTKPVELFPSRLQLPPSQEERLQVIITTAQGGKDKTPLDTTLPFDPNKVCKRIQQADLPTPLERFICKSAYHTAVSIGINLDQEKLEERMGIPPPPGQRPQVGFRIGKGAKKK